MSQVDKINDRLPYPLGLPAKHLEKRIPPTLTMKKIIMYYTVWNWIILVLALSTGWTRITRYSQASSLLVACIIACAWSILGWPFFQQFYAGILMTKTSWIIALVDFVVHFSPVLIMGLPSHIGLPTAMPLLTFWVWYMAMRPHLKNLYVNTSSLVYDTIAIRGTLLWMLILLVILYLS